MDYTRWLVLLAAMAFWACEDTPTSSGTPTPTMSGSTGSSGTPTPTMGGSAGSSGTPTPTMGGSTGDFGGSCVCDPEVRELGLSQDHTVLGFSAQDVLARITGEYALDMVWADDCLECEDAAPAFTGSETEVRIAISSTATTARVAECNYDHPPLSPCRLTAMFVSVEGVLTTTDGLLDEAFELELMTQALDGVGIGDRVAAADLTGSLPVEVPHLDLVEWSFFGVTETVAAFEVFVVTDDSNRLESQPTEGGRNPAGQSWGVEVDLDQARQ